MSEINPNLLPDATESNKGALSASDKAKLNAYPADPNTLGGGGVFTFTYSNNYTQADPGNGFLRFDDSPIHAEAMYLSFVNNQGHSLQFLLTTLFGYQGSQVILSKASAPNNFVTYTVVPVADNGSWLELSVTVLDVAGTTWNDGDTLNMEIIPAGHSHGTASPNPGGSAGFMSAEDKTKLDAYPATPSVINAIAILQDRKASGTVPQTLTQNVYVTREINTEVYDPGDIVSIASNQFTLIPGTYLVEWEASHKGGGNVYTPDKTRLYNVSDAVVVDVSMMGGAYAGPGHMHGTAQFVIASSKTYRIEHILKDDVPTSTAGTAASTGDPEIYLNIKITKIG